MEWDAIASSPRNMDTTECIIDSREYDVPYYFRVAIDNDIRVGLWYAVVLNQERNSKAWSGTHKDPNKKKASERYYRHLF